MNAAKLYAWLMEEGCWQDENGDWKHKDDAKESGATYGTHASNSNVVERCRKYVAKMDPAVSGQHGHDSCWFAAQAICRGFGLSFADGWPILVEFNQRCQPPWSEVELKHKAEDAAANSRLPHGYIVNKPNPHYTNGHGGGNGNGNPRIHLKEDVSDIEVEPRPKVAPFPLQSYPDALVQFICEIAESMSCPVDFPAVAALTMAASAMGTSTALYLKRTWQELPRFYTAVVADAGSAKSPAVRMICKPFYKLQKKRHTEWEAEIKNYEVQKAAFEASKRAARKNNANASASVEVPVRPPYPHFFTTDATTEVLASILAQTPRGLVLIRDEVTGWVLSMNQYKGGKGADRQFWLTAWSGEPTKVDRKSNEGGQGIFNYHPFINVIGAVPPDMLSTLCDEQAREDGFVHRILFTYPDQMNPGHWTEAEPSLETEGYWNDALNKLFELAPESHPDEGICPRLVTFQPEAKDVWVDWYNGHVDEMADSNLPPDLVGPWSKMRQYAARVTLVLHQLRLAYLDTKSLEIDTDSMAKAAAIADYFKSHARRVYCRLQSRPNDERANKMVRWLQGRGGSCTARDVMRAKLAKTSKESVVVLQDLEDRGFGKLTRKEKDNGTVISSFSLSPSLSPN